MLLRWRSCTLLVMAAGVTSSVIDERQSVRGNESPAIQHPADDAADVFFDNAFEQALVGERPKSLQPARIVSSARVPAQSESSLGVRPSGRWSRVISGTVLEDEIKALHESLLVQLRSPSHFASGHQAARDSFALLANLFDVVARYEGEVRWKAGAAAARDRFVLAAEQTEHGDAQGYSAARAALDELQDLLSGEPLADPPAAQPAGPDAADRVALMRRLELSVDTRLSAWLSSKTNLRQHAAAIRHESEVIAVLSEILTEESMPDAADEDYRTLAESLRDSATQLGRERTLEDFTAATRIMAVIRGTCEECHETYR